MPSPEAAARAEIDRQLEMAGWVVQDIAAANRFAGRGVAVRVFRLAEGHGRADYTLYVDGKAVGVVEAKPAGTTLTAVEPQVERYSRGLTATRPGSRSGIGSYGRGCGRCPRDILATGTGGSGRSFGARAGG